MKLGLVIKITSDGEKEYPLSFNKDGKWEKYITDVRSSIKELADFDGTGKTVLLVRFLGKIGYLIGVIKVRPEGSGRPFDNTAAWIYFPAHISISGNEMVRITDEVEKAISGSDKIDNDLLTEIFNTDYKEDNLLFSASDSINSNANVQLGVMYYGNHTQYQQHELLGKSIAQSGYKHYKGIFFINRNSGITLKGNSDSEIKVKPECLIKAPKSTDGFIPYWGGNEFNKDLSVPSGCRIVVVWKKPDFEDIIKDVITKGNYDESELMINPSDYKVSVSRDWFKVCDEKGNVLDDVDLSINGLQLKDKLIISFDSFDKGVIVTASKQGYDDFRKEGFKISRNSRIELKKETYSYEYVFDRDSWNNNQSFKDVRLIIKSEHRIENSPIKGFRIADRGDDYLSPDNLKLKLKFFAGGVIACLIPVLLIVGWNAIEDYEPVFDWPPLKEKENKQDSKNQNATEQQASLESETNSSGLTFNDYLDKNRTWSKQSLDYYKNGFYDLLIKYNIDSVKKMNLNSRTLREIIKAYENNKQAVDSMNKVESDYKSKGVEIKVEDYIKEISKIRIAEAESTSSNQGTSRSGNSGNEQTIRSNNKNGSGSADNKSNPELQKEKDAVQPKRGGSNKILL